MLVLQAHQLMKKSSHKWILNKLSLNVKEGEIVGLIGPNGAGKTSCFHALVGLSWLDGGKILLGQHDVTYLNIAQRAQLGLSYLPQEASIFRNLSVRENIEGVLQLQNFSKNEIQDKTQKLLIDFSLTHLENHPAYILSGGERRRLEIARALSINPKILLLDEPFAGVDPISVQEIQRIIIYLRSLGMSVLITDHNVRDILEICDRVYLSYAGCILKEGTSQEILKDEFAISRYLGNNFSL